MIDERPVEADDDLARRRAEDGVGHSGPACRLCARSVARAAGAGLGPGDAAGLDQLREAVLVVLGLEPLGLGGRPRPRGRRRRAAASCATPRCSRCRRACRPGSAALSMATWKRGWRTTLLDRRPSLATTWAGMSRHQMMVRVAISQAAPVRWPGCDRRGQVAVAGRADARRRGRGGRRRPRALAVSVRVVGLGEVDEPPVVAEVRSAAARDAGRGRGRGSRAARSGGRGSRSGRTCRAPRPCSAAKAAAAGVELVAVRAGEALDALLARGPRRARRRCRSRRRRRRSAS